MDAGFVLVQRPMDSDHRLSGTVEDKMRIRLHGLVVACPFDQGNSEFCPLHNIRRLSPSERFEWVESLTLREMEPLLAHHDSCLESRVSKDFSEPARTPAAEKFRI